MVFSAVRPIVMSFSVSSIVVASEPGESMCSFGIGDPVRNIAEARDRVNYESRCGAEIEGCSLKPRMCSAQNTVEVT